MTPTPHPRRLTPFHVHIATLFILLFTVLGGALIALQFQQGLRQGAEHAEQRFLHYREQLSLALALNEEPARLSLSLLARGGLADTTTLAARLPYVPQLVATLAHRASDSAVYVGYASGDFFLVRKLDGVRRQGLLTTVPVGSRWVVQSLEGGVGHFVFYDDALRVLAQRAMPDYRFDPRTRPWYQQAMASPQIVVTHPYLFFTTHEPGRTLALRSPRQQAVLGLDTSVAGLSTTIGQLSLPAYSRLVIVDDQATLLAADPASLPTYASLTALPTLSALDHPVFGLLEAQWRQGTLTAGPALAREHSLILPDGYTWRVSLAALGDGSPFYMALLVAADTLQQTARDEALRDLAWTALGLLLLLPIIWLVSQRTAAPLLALTREAERIGRFDFGGHRVPGSAIREIDDLARTMSAMRLTLGNFMNMGRALAVEHRFDSLLTRIVQESLSAVQAHGGCIYLLQGHQMIPAEARWQDTALPREVATWQDELFGSPEQVVRRTVLVDEGLWQAAFAAWGPYQGPSELVIEPLLNHRDQPIGCLLLLLPAAAPPALLSRLCLIDALAGSAASAIHNQQLIAEQKQLLEAFIELMAGAIDAKSPYTGGHCQRVPALTQLLTRAACDQQVGPFADFTLNDEQWEAIHIASWLHDCGKITTPEYVVDKATKLETLYDRIHEVRTRFEVLKRDAHIETLRARLSPADHAACLAEVAPAWRVLDEEFAFVAQCNLGEEEMAAEKLARLAAIAERTWWRTLDDRLGLSRDALALRADTPVEHLPCRETLLADKPYHRVPRPAQERLDERNPWGFKVSVPDCLYDRGERYNLAVRRGTLTEEERYKINEHIIQTIRMLERLPFPRHLRTVPEIAGSHHERVDGKGYPRRLTGAHMSVPARIMAIADVFEALTAADRPYKSPKTVSQSLAILCTMACDGHLDAALFRLFVTDRIWDTYAVRFLAPEQRDEVDVAALLARLDA